MGGNHPKRTMKTLKRRPIQEEKKGTIETIWLGMRDGGIPRDSERLQRIVLALLTCIGRKSPKQALDIAGHIQALAGVEQRFPMCLPEQLAREKGKRRRRMEEANELVSDLLRSYEAMALREIQSGKAPRTQHARATVLLQRDMMTEYLEGHPFKIRSGSGLLYVRRADAAKKWLAEYGAWIWSHLFAIPCFCGYRESFDGLLGDHDALSDCTGSAYLIDLLLAHLHTRIKPDGIRKIISHAPSLDL